MSKIKPQAKVLLIALGVGAIYGLLQIPFIANKIPQVGFMQALVPQKAVLPDVKEAQVQNVTPATLPSSSEASVSSVLIRGSI